MTAGPTPPRGSAARTPLELATARNDRGMQDLLASVGNTAVDAARILLDENGPVVICTGFPVNGAPETDGPPGAFALADALCSLGKAVSVASWAQGLRIFAKVRGDLSFLDIAVGRDGARGPAARGAVVTVEVCGQCADGSYRNMRGVDIGAERASLRVRVRRAVDRERRRWRKRVRHGFGAGLIFSEWRVMATGIDDCSAWFRRGVELRGLRNSQGARARVAARAASRPSRPSRADPRPRRRRVRRRLHRPGDFHRGRRGHRRNGSPARRARQTLNGPPSGAQRPRL